MLKLTLDRTEGTFEITSEDRVYIRDEEVKISVAGFKSIELNGDTSLAPCFQVICGQKVLAEAMLAYDKSASDTANDYGYVASGTLNTNTEQLARHFGGCADQTCQSLVCRVFSTAKMKPIAMGYVSLWNFPNGGTEPSNLTTGADLQKRIDAALTAATNAETSATKAGESATAAAASASDAAASASTAKAAMESAQAAQNVAETKANVATEQASNALTYANAANASEAKAKTYAENAEASADAAAESAKEAASILPASVQDALGKFLSGQTFKTNTTNAMRNAMKTLLKALGATVSVLALTFCGVCVAADTPTVTKASLGDLDLDQNPTVVTDVSFSGLATKDDVADAVKNAKVSTDGLVTADDFAEATNKLTSALVDAGKVKSVNGDVGDVEVTAAGIGARARSDLAVYNEGFLLDGMKMTVRVSEVSTSDGTTVYEYARGVDVEAPLSLIDEDGSYIASCSLGSVPLSGDYAGMIASNAVLKVSGVLPRDNGGYYVPFGAEVFFSGTINLGSPYGYYDWSTSLDVTVSADGSLAPVSYGGDGTVSGPCGTLGLYGSIDADPCVEKSTDTLAKSSDVTEIAYSKASAQDLAAVKAAIPVVSATDATFSNAVLTAASDELGAKANRYKFKLLSGPRLIFANDGMIYSFRGIKNGFAVTLPTASKTNVQDFVLRVTTVSTNGTHIAAISNLTANVDFPMGDPREPGSLKGTNYVTFTQTTESSWCIGFFPATKKKEE